MTSKDRAQSPAPTQVVSRFFNKKEAAIPEGVRLDEPPPESRTNTVRTAVRNQRTTRVVGHREVHTVDTVGVAPWLAALEAEAPDMIDRAARERAPSLRQPHVLTTEQQFACYLGNCAPLMLHARERYGDAGTGGMTTRQVRAWLKANPQYIPEHLRSVDFHVDHIVSDGIGGQNWPLNYFLMPSETNLWFGGWMTLQKRQYVGMPAWTGATNFSMWCAQKSRAVLPFGTFDPVADKFLSKRGR